MIVKEYHPIATTDRFQKAGDEAEQQMAFYLRRAFGDSPDVHIFNNLRLPHGEDTAQIDHLILHRAGLVIVESKSVNSSVRINEREEWAREWNGRWSGMRSPVVQARMQGDLLQAHSSELRNKTLFGFKQGDFSDFSIQVVVAISDRGVIESHGPLSDVKKADQTPEHIKKLLQGRPMQLAPDEFARISAFLLNHHQDKAAPKKANLENPEKTNPAKAPALAAKPPAPSTVPSPAPPIVTSVPAANQFLCSKCKSADLEIKFGHSYYFHCRQCSANTPIKLTCPTCGSQTRTRKSGKQFFRECAKCDSSELFFTNP